MSNLKASYESKHQDRDQRHDQYESQFGYSLFHPSPRNPPRPEQGLVEVENPQRSGHAEQNYTRNVIDAMQNELIIHDGQGSLRL
jgi:hypothetical protein